MRSSLALLLLLSSCFAAPLPAPTGSKSDGALVAAGDAVAFVSVAADFGSWRLLFHRLDEAGRPGAEVELAAGLGSSGPRSTLATDGARHFACWAIGGQISCAFPGKSPSFEVAGSSPSLANGDGVWVLAYATAAGVSIQSLGADGLAVGAPQQLFTGDRLTPMLEATADGFLIVSGEPMRVQRLDRDLRPAGAAIDLGQTYWQSGSLAAAGSTFVVVLGKPYGSTVFAIEANRIQRTFELGGGGKLGLEVALVSDGEAVAGAWSSDAPQWSVPLGAATSAAEARGGPVALARVGAALFVATLKDKQLALTPVTH